MSQPFSVPQPTVPWGRKLRRFLKNPLKHPRLAWIHAWFSLRRLLYRRGRRRLFIDCGSNLGQGFDFFSRLFPRPYFDHVMLEPNPYCLARLQQRYGSLCSLEIVGAAAWTQSGTTRFFGLVEDERGPLSNGGSIVTEHNSERYEPAHDSATLVQTLDFSEFVRSKAEDYDEIVIKMDIESGEYEVLEKMLEDHAFERVSTLFVEFHSRYMKAPTRREYQERERKLRKRLPAVTRFYEWH